MLSCDRNIPVIVAVALVAALAVWPIEPVKAAILNPRTTSITLRFHSGDLDTPRGVADLYRRIRAAAQSVCGEPDDTLLLYKPIWDQCVDQAIAGAVARVHSESLSAYRGLQFHGRKRLLVEAPKSLAVREAVAHPMN
jgi:UrcA family protein